MTLVIKVNYSISLFFLFNFSAVVVKNPLGRTWYVEIVLGELKLIVSMFVKQLLLYLLLFY